MEDKGARRLGLVGCVKKKTTVAATARDLYTSPLFLGRRGHVERRCSQWWILSALHGLVEPDRVLDPYDLALTQVGVSKRREWSRQVLEALVKAARPGEGDIVEIHAGAAYRDHGLVEGLERYGCVVEVPTRGLSLGQQLRFYSAEGAR